MTSRTSVLAVGILLLGAFSLRCSDSGSADTNGGGNANPSSANGPDVGDGGAGGKVGQIDGVVTKLPLLPTLTNVVGTENDDSAEVTFDPVDGSRDYRIYPLPSDDDITIGGDGQVTVKNALYRCGGDRSTPQPTIDDAAENQGAWVRTRVDNQMVGGYLRTMADATLGHVYIEPGPDRIPVYALGESDPSDDNTCYFARWGATRVKRYTSSETERTQLLADFARDDGIAFWVPKPGTAGTTGVFVDIEQPNTPYAKRFYVADGPEAASHPQKTPAFAILTNAAPGTQPLMRVFYENKCGRSHDELAVGKERFARAYQQGDKLPYWSLLWSGITEPTTLVVEALDTGCPYQGHLSPTSLASVTAQFGDTNIVHPAHVTIEEMRAASPSSEVFINGQHDPAGRPKAIARSFVRVGPRPHPPMDFFADFSTKAAPETFTPVPCGSPDSNCFQTWRLQSPTWDAIFMNVETGPTSGTGLFTFGPRLGQLWVNHADWASDTNGRVRLTPKQKATMSASSFLHVTMEVDAVSTGRRYPQILISDRDAPIQYTLEQGHTLVVQTRGQGSAWFDYPIDYELQVCNLRTWDVNNQCPSYDLHRLKTAAGDRLAPHDEVGELTSVDRSVTFDVYASTTRTYLFIDKKPYACALLPSGTAPNGPVTVTWGDVLYHSAVDHLFKFHAERMQTDTRRHFDNLGFSSGVTAPAWDETRLPCVQPITL
jgi:hypothetical protein